jgi:hypothetical protein
MLYEPKGSSVVCPYENVSPPQKFVTYCLSPFPNHEEYKWKHSIHLRHKKYYIKKAIWDEPIEMV